MKALEFFSKIDGNTIKVPEKFNSDLTNFNNRKIRVIMLIEETDEYKDEQDFKTIAAEEFFKGYSSIDSVYDEEYGDDQI